MTDRCRVYWGSHGCDKPAAHRGPHWCDCCECPSHLLFWRRESGCVGTWPYYGWGTRFYGEDAELYQRRIRASLSGYWHRTWCKASKHLPTKRRPWNPCGHGI